MTQMAQAEDASGNNCTAYREAFDRFVEQMNAEGFNATLDQPSCFVYRELMDYYPNSTVLKTERSASAWARFMIDVILFRFVGLPATLQKCLEQSGQSIWLLGKAEAWVC